ncbi:hypothetical protein ACYCS5_12000 [Paenibacillus sp. SEL3]|uniref:hypothetical protein n=1 Tax=Paenibacillus polymyxa TaxID=1406 RepID=UPI001ABB605B|nr:hypothetical protein [Paenibacillus polymyxa]MBO3285310.1 hypothetical protein [Paenibacillus polymyxa]
MLEDQFEYFFLEKIVPISIIMTSKRVLACLSVNSALDSAHIPEPIIYKSFDFTAVGSEVKDLNLEKRQRSPLQ